MKQENRGGARAGSGRKAVAPSKKRVQMVVTIDRETRDFIKSFSKERHIRPGRLIDDLVTSHRDNLEE